MNRATFYIEFLIVGTFAMAALGAATGYDLDSASGLKLLALAPLAYISGLVVEALGVVPERLLRWATEDDGPIAPSRTVMIMAWNEHVGEELKLRRSRDRIARGALIVVILFYAWADLSGTSVISIPDAESSIPDAESSRGLQRAILLGLAAFLAVTWVVLHKRTRDFKAQAFAAAGGQD